MCFIRESIIILKNYLKILPRLIREGDLYGDYKVKLKIGQDMVTAIKTAFR